MIMTGYRATVVLDILEFGERGSIDALGLLIGLTWPGRCGSDPHTHRSNRRMPWSKQVYCGVALLSIMMNTNV